MTQIRVMTAIELIRNRPGMYFESGRASMSELISFVMRDAGRHSDMNAAIRRKGPFAMVYADVDWMKTERASIPELFDRFVLPEERRPNSHRSEILLSAVCDGVLTIASTGTFSLSLRIDDLPQDWIEESKSAVRSLYWKFSG